MAKKTVDNYCEIINTAIEKVMWCGETASSVAETFDISTSDMCQIIAVVKAAKRGDVAEVISRLNKKNNAAAINLVIAAYKVAEMEIPSAVKEEIDKKEKAYRESQTNNLSKGVGRENHSSVEEKKTTPLWAQSMLLNQAKALEQFRDLNDAVVPKYAKDIVDALNKLDTHLIQLINKLS